MSIKHDHTLHPITALAFYGGNDDSLLLFAAEGPWLKIFEAKTSDLVHQCQIFEGQTVHGVAVQADVLADDALQVVIWGGHQLLMLTRSEVHDLISQRLATPRGSSSTASDWILDVAISPQNDRACALVTAHNAVLRAARREDNSIIIEELHSPSKSILYSAHLVWTSLETLLIAAGTVFGEIIAWRCLIPDTADQSEGKVLFTFTGHEGSIFGVDISPPILRPDGSTGRLLASCSDDRTIRIWDLESEVQNFEQQQTIPALRETGFGDNGQNAESHCVAVAMGHVSRIWRVKFLTQSSPATLINILSFGEDSTTQQWSMALENMTQPIVSSNQEQSLSSRLHGKLLHQKTSGFHSGKHIWSLAICESHLGHHGLATGGADGKIAMYPIEVLAQSKPSSELHEPSLAQPSHQQITRYEWDPAIVLADLCLPVEMNQQAASTNDPIFGIEDEQPTEPVAKKKKAKKIPKDSFNRYAFVTDNQIILTTIFGHVVIGYINEAKWKEIAVPKAVKDDLKAWSVVKSSTLFPTVFLAGNSGTIYAYQVGSDIYEVGRVDSKVADMFVMSDVKGGISSLLVTTLYAKQVTVFTVTCSAEAVSLTSPILYDLPAGFIVTSAGKVGDQLVLGSRYGCLAVYDSERRYVDIGDADSTLRGDAVTTITSLPISPSTDQPVCFLTTGRKGMYSIFALTSSSSAKIIPQSRNLSLIHQGTPPFGPMIEHAWYSQDQDLLLFGFKSKNFVVWNETKQCEVLSVECGGAHRSYAYIPQGQGGKFLYTKASSLYLYSQPKPSHHILKSGGHGREIKACAISGDHRLIATGAEDTSIRVWTYLESEGRSAQTSFECLAVVQKHTAGIQHLQWHQSNYLFSSGGNEEFFIWAVSPLPTGGIGIMCEATCPDQSEECDLRIMNFDITQISSSDDGEPVLLISLAYSDSTIKVYSYAKSQGYRLVASGRYTSACLMQIKVLAHDNSRVSLLTAATDGFVTLWAAKVAHGDGEAAQDLVMISKKKVHQSSIKSMDTTYLDNESRIVVATGGDDDALGITIYNRAGLFASTASPTKVFILRSAHSAAVTGLSFVPSVGDDSSDSATELILVSSSNDQRVKEWRISLRSEGNDLQLFRKAGDVFTPVADVGDLACLRSNRERSGGKILLVGNGMEVWKVGGNA